jgi:mono/diheme cytochrome c family protein
MSNASSWALLSVIGLVAACSGAASPPATNPGLPPPPPAAPPVAAVPSVAPAASSLPAPRSFFAMSDDQKMQHMKKVIKPTMGKLFTAYDGAKYGEFGCKTCHGPNNDEPQKVLPKLTLSGNGFQKLATDKPAIVKFMTEQVTPAMATAMGEAPFNPATHKGFGCAGCHSVN